MARILALVLSSLIALIAITLMVMTNHYLTQDHSKLRISAPTPDFASFTNAKDKKDAFFAYLLPMIRESNKTILGKRARLDGIAQKLTEGKLKKADSKFLNQLANEYGIDNTNPAQASTEQKIELLKLRVDQVPESLALVQAAKESGWGTSRFARDANNYFGQWCYKPGCGLVPKQRPEGATHEVRKFDHVADSVEGYLKNLNTHQAYEELRQIRASLRAENKVSGIALAEGLSSYSQRGRAYINEIQSMIRFNQLDELDKYLR